MPYRRLTTIALAAATAVLLTACGPGQPGSSEPVAGDQIRVTDNRFEPSSLQATTGDTVTWVWEGRIPHDVVGDGFDSGIQDEGTFTHTFDEPGTYDYRCSLHGGMTGQVVVAS